MTEEEEETGNAKRESLGELRDPSVLLLAGVAARAARAQAISARPWPAVTAAPAASGRLGAASGRFLRHLRRADDAVVVVTRPAAHSVVLVRRIVPGTRARPSDGVAAGSG